MIPTPEINFNRTPVTLILATLVLALEVVCTLDPERRYMYVNGYRLGMWWWVWLGELWRPFTCALLHGNLIHALFNIYWLAIFGPTLENWLGSYKTLALIVLLAYISSLAQYMLGNWFVDLSEQHGLVGLSGVVYGMFGLLWVGGWHRAELRAICNEMVAQGMIAWFVFCIVATYLDWLRIANIAHGAGLVLGMLIGMAVFKPRQRWLWALAAALVSCLMLATLLAAPGHPGYEIAQEYKRRLRQRDELLKAYPDLIFDENLLPIGLDELTTDEPPLP